MAWKAGPKIEKQPSVLTERSNSHDSQWYGCASNRYMYHEDAQGNSQDRNAYENSKVAVPPLLTETCKFVRVC